jgi:uridine kinase
MGTIKIIKDMFPDDSLKTTYSVQEGVFCRLDNSLMSKREVKQFSLKLNEWVESNSPIEFLGKEEGLFKYRVGDIIVKTLYSANDYSSMVEPFCVIPFSTGFIVDFGDMGRGLNTPLIPPEKLSAAYDKHENWLKNINMELVSDVNDYITSARSIELLSVAEALQEKEISDIADIILQQRRALRVLLISGPTSAGKTTFTRRLSTQLRVNGLKTVPISLDDYFIDREQSPLDSDGNYDFENIEALDLKLLQHHIAQLINGEAIKAPVYDFASGKRIKKRKTIHVGPSEILIIEGIHALDPNILPNINKNVFFKIIINALFGLNVDLVNRIPSTEVRLIRRMVRDDRYRGIHPEETLDRWDRVRRGEYSNIFKYQEDCDVLFNSSLLYEMNALRPFAEVSLKKIHEGSAYYDTRERLLDLLTFFIPMGTSKIPFNSILREFIGGSIYYRQRVK